MAFSSVDQVINAVCANGYMQSIWFQKTLSAACVAWIPHSFWYATGVPGGAGSSPTLGLNGATTYSSSSTGCLPYTNPSGGRSMHMISMAISSPHSTGGTVVLVDRLAAAQVDVDAVTGGSFSPAIDAYQSGSGRLASGEGAQIMLEVVTPFGATYDNTLTLTYTNQSGTSSRSTASVTLYRSRAEMQSPMNYPNNTAYPLFVPLQSGDQGVRSIESIDITGSQTTGTFNIVLVKPVTYLPLAFPGMLTERDFVVDMPSLPELPDSSCLTFYGSFHSAAAATLFGNFRIAEN